MGCGRGVLARIVWMNLDRATGRGSFQDRTFTRLVEGQ